MKVIENVELVEVKIEDAKATLTFLDAEAGEIREVNFNKKVYDKDNKKFVPDADKAAQVEEWSQQFFGLAFDDLEQAVGQRHTVYCYEKFNSMFESNIREVAKFDADYVGQILNGEIVEVAVESEGIRIYVDYEGQTYRSNMGYTKQVAGQYYPDPQKKIKQLNKFEEKFHVKAEDGAALVGKTVMFEVKKFAGNNAIYIEIKPFPKKKAK
jgi:hypothetical protein